jgi:hypothetical protein
MSGDILCRRIESSPHKARFRGSKTNIRVALPAPGALTGFENLWCFLDECALLLRRELHHSPGLVGHSKRRENLSGNTEIGMIHVRPLDGCRNFQGHVSKLVGSHLMRDLCRSS